MNNIKLVTRTIVDSAAGGLAASAVHKYAKSETRPQKIRTAMIAYFVGGVAAGFTRKMVGEKVDELVEQAVAYVKKQKES